MQSDYEEAWDKMIQTYKIKKSNAKCVFDICLKSQFFLPFSIFLVLFMSFITLFGIIYKSYRTISAIF